MYTTIFHSASPGEGGMMALGEGGKRWDWRLLGMRTPFGFEEEGRWKGRGEVVVVM